MFARLIGVAAVARSKKRWDITEERKIYNNILAEELRILQNHAQFYKFRRFPFTFWILGFCTLSLSIFMNYFLFYIASREERHYLYIIMTILLYYSTFFILYAGKIELVTIDKKKGIIKYELINMFLSKIEKKFKLDDLIDIEIVLKGIIRRDGDYTRYHIRISFKDKGTILFGECMTLRRVVDKVNNNFKKCLAIIKGIVMPDVIDRGMITNETYDETTSMMKE